MSRVVVGVDSRGRSKQALIRALREAELRDARLEAVYVFNPDDRDVTRRISESVTSAWQPDGVAEIFASMDSPPETGPSDHYQRARQQAIRLLGAATDEALGKGAMRRVRGVVLAGTEPAEELVRHAEGADLLVIGVRQRSPVGKLILGSDARDIILRSRVPVLSVPDEFQS